MMSGERTPLLHHDDESRHVHGNRQHHPHHTNSHHHSLRDTKPAGQGTNLHVDQGRVDQQHHQDPECPTNPFIEAEQTSDPYECLGFAFAVLAGICFTSSNVMVKYLVNVTSWELLFVRCIIQASFMLPLILVHKKSVFGPPDFPTRSRVFAQGVLGGILLLCIFEAVADLPLGDATAIFFSSPAFTMLLSTCILRDHCGFFRTFVAVALLGGVVILSRPPSLFPPAEIHAKNMSRSTDHDPYVGGYNAIGLITGIAVPILSAFIVIITRQAKHVHYSVLVFWFAIGGLVVSIIGMNYFNGPNDEHHHGSVYNKFLNWNEEQWVLTFLIALVGLIGSILMTKAVCWVTPSKVMVVRSFEVVVAYILQVTVFDTPTHVSDVFGTMLVILAVLSMGIEDPLMRRFSCRFL